MKNLLLTLVALACLGMAACKEKTGKDISEYSDATAADSLLFYFVQLRAHEFWEMAQGDTSFRSAEARERFLDGLEDGFNSVIKDDKYYNLGVRTGVRMAINLREFDKRYDIDIRTERAVPAFRYGLRDGADIPELNYQEEFYRLLDQMKSHQRERDHERARLTLIEEARHQEMSKINDDLYFRLLRKGSGSYAEYGNAVYVKVSFERADGEDIAVPSPGLVTIGAPGVPEALNLAYTRLNKGAVGLFATTAEALFGSRTYIMDMKPEDVLLVTITLNDIVSPAAVPDDSI